MMTFNELKTRLEPIIKTRKAELKAMKAELIAKDSWEYEILAIENILACESEIAALQYALKYKRRTGEIITRIAQSIEHDTAKGFREYFINGKLAAMNTVEAIINE